MGCKNYSIAIVRYKKTTVYRKTKVFLDKRKHLYYPSTVFELFFY